MHQSGGLLLARSRPSEYSIFATGENDVSMLDDADFAFCPKDAIVAGRYPNVCSCAEGAVADVIYEKIPEILGVQP